jgi:hypothetical protein
MRAWDGFIPRVVGGRRNEKRRVEEIIKWELDQSQLHEIFLHIGRESGGEPCLSVFEHLLLLESHLSLESQEVFFEVRMVIDLRREGGWGGWTEAGEWSSQPDDWSEPREEQEEQSDTKGQA